VIEALRGAGERGIEPTKKAWSDAATQVKQILTLEQLAKLAIYDGELGSPPPPATQPN
jgi:hypothetical protein